MGRRKGLLAHHRHGVRRYGLLWLGRAVVVGSGANRQNRLLLLGWGLATVKWVRVGQRWLRLWRGSGLRSEGLVGAVALLLLL